jgi:hypothetical protein
MLAAISSRSLEGDQAKTRGYYSGHLIAGFRSSIAPTAPVRRVPPKTRHFIYRLALKLLELTPWSPSRHEARTASASYQCAKRGFMTRIVPEGTKCGRCDVPIKMFEPFVVYRFGREVQIWHKRSCILEEHRGELRFNQLHHAQQAHQVHAVTAT